MSEGDILRALWGDCKHDFSEMVFRGAAGQVGEKWFRRCSFCAEEDLVAVRTYGGWTYTQDAVQRIRAVAKMKEARR